MSNPLKGPPKNISTTVKCLNVHHDSNPFLPSPSQTRSKPIASDATSAFEEESETTTSIENVRKAASFGESSPLLSERESIFAINYLPSDGNSQTPRLPAAEGANDVANLPQDLKTEMEFALPSSPPHSPISFKRLLPPRKSRSSLIVNNVAHKKLPDTSTPSSKQIEDSRGIIHTVRQMASEGQSGKQILQLRVTDQNHPLAAENSSAILGSEEMGKVGNDGKEDSGSIPEPSQARREREPAMRETFRQTGSKERSPSRGRSHVEKSIEATLPNREPAKNVRTRKSSHLMGIFKETASSELRKRDAQSKSAKVRHDGGAAVMPSLEDMGVLQQLHSQSTRSTPSALFNEEPLPFTISAKGLNRPTSAHFGDLSIQTEQNISVALSDTANSYPSTPVSPYKAEHDPYFRKRDEIKRPMSSKRPAIPAKLLEDIRKHHNLTPTGDGGATLSHSLPSLVDVDEPEKPTSTKDVRVEDTENQDDEDEEHISSAVYFPHPGPSDEDIEQFTSPDEEQKQEPFPPSLTSATPTPKAELKRNLSDTAPPEHIDISVKSKHEKSVFHGDYLPAEELVDDEDDFQPRPPWPISEIVIDSASSASESEISSGEELGNLSQAEEGEVTPTSTPIPQSLLQRRKRTMTTAAPKGAVVLEPYSHQVGGHSTLFRFSRRAICKQLNNRENEFYERIEQRHPDMLRFLPRYIGVLNVTFSKGPKPSKQAPSVAGKGIENGQSQVPSDTMQSNGSIELPHDQAFPHSKRAEVAEPPRIVSQSQQVGEVPRVILDQNRHIVPFSLFGSPERPRSADPHHDHLKGTLSPVPHDARATSDTANDTRSNGGSPPRPRLPEHSASWGTTTVNSKLREQVLREVFGPPLIHHYKEHAKGHSTLPRLRAPSHRKTHLSEVQHDPHRRNASIPADQWRIPVPNDAHAPTQQQEELLTPKGEQPSANAYSTSASEFEGLSRGLEKVKTTSSTESQHSEGSPRGRLRRRRSGMGLRRRRNSVNGDVRGNLGYFEEEGYGGDGEKELFGMEGHDPRPIGSTCVPSGAVPRDLKTSAAFPKAAKGQGNETSGGFKADSTLRLPDLGTQHLPLNPKEAQTQNPDQRVEFFLLLEDLTAGMGRPCVLDLKMGTRQYGIDANKKKMESQRRKCKTTTSQQLGVRICGMQTYNVKKREPAYEDKYFGRDVKAGREFRDALTRFLYDGVNYSSVSRHIPAILDKISKLENMVRRLPGYRFYASSLLMLYDAEPQKSQKAIEEAQKSKDEGTGGERPKEEKKRSPPIELKIVDFANCVTGEDELPAEAPCPPQHPDDIDRGYLKGLRTLRMYFLRILRDINQEEWVERGEGEGMAVGLGGGKQGPPEGGIEDDAGEVSI